jgi:hypothetical protein
MPAATAPVLIFGNDFTDSGLLANDGITNDNSFSLGVIGERANGIVTYEISTDDGSTWANTTANQSGLDDGYYQFRSLISHDYAFGFSGDFDQAYWTMSAGGDGSINANNDTVILHGADSGGETYNNVDFTISSPLEFRVSFQWSYSTSDYFSYWDSFGYLVNDTFYQLTENFGPTEQSGSVSLMLAAGDTFGFRQNSLDSESGRATTTISNFETLYSSVYTNVESITIDTKALAPTLSLASDTGFSNSDGITNNSTLNASRLEAGASWEYSADGGRSWTRGTGSSFLLASGSYSAGSILVRQIDLAGNTSTNGQLGAVTIDTTSPFSSAAITAVIDNVGFIRGTVDQFSGTDDATPSFSGSISAALVAGETLAIYNRDTFLGNAKVNNTTKRWSFIPASLSRTIGEMYEITARVIDIAGNYSQSPIRYFFLDTTASTTTASIVSVVDNVGHMQGVLANRAVTDDITPTISGVLSAPLAAGETVRLYNGANYLGQAISANGAETWSYTSILADVFYSIKARVVDAVGNLGAASVAQKFSIDSISNQLMGDGSNNTLMATDSKDLITGLRGADTFTFNSLTQSTLANFDRIADFRIGTDILDAPTAISAANINKLGFVAALDAQSISAVLTSSNFAANQAATFSYADPSVTLRSFIALNDGVAGFSASNDAIVEITGYTGSLNNLQIM